MDNAKVPMRGKIKDAEAEALLKLLRREQENAKEQSIPQIQRKEPLPAIGNNIKGTSVDSSSCFPIEEQLLAFHTQSKSDSRLSDSELLNDSFFVRTNNSINVLGAQKTTAAEIYVPPYSWRNEKMPSPARSERSGKAKNAGRNLPPIEYNFIASRENGLNHERPVGSHPSSPRQSPEYYED